MSESKFVSIGTTRTGGLCHRSFDGLNFSIPPGGLASVSIREAMEALAMYPDVFCAELLVPCPPRHQFSGDYEIAMPETGWPSDRSQFNMVYGAARDPLALAMNPALLQSDRILCEFCQKDYAMAGIYRHIQAAHPEEYDAWKARLDATKAEAAPGVRTLSPAPAEGPAPAEDPEADGPATPPPADTDDEGLDDIERDMTEETL